MRRLWNSFNASNTVYQPDYAQWLIELALSEANQQYMISAGTEGRLHEPKGMPTTVHDNLTSAVLNTSECIYNKTKENCTMTVENSSLVISDRDLDVTDYVLIVMYSVTTLLAILGNSFAIVVFAKGKRSKTDLRPFLINLAVADLIMAFFCIPFTFTYSLLDSNWIFGTLMCPIVMFLQTVSVTGSVSTNMAIGIDRFCAIAFPLNSTRNTANRYRLTIASIWLIAVAISVVLLFVGKAVPNHETGHRECNENWANRDLELFYTILLLILTYIVPLIILMVTYSIVGYILCKRRLPGNADIQRDATQLRAKLKIVKMLVTVVVLFALCWLPLHIFFFVLNFTEKEHHPKLTLPYFICHWIAMSNSFVNPIVYGLLNDSFRADFKALVLRCFSPLFKRHPKSARHGAIKIRTGTKSYHLSYGSHSLENDQYLNANHGPFERNGSERTFIKYDTSSLQRGDTY